MSGGGYSYVLMTRMLSSTKQPVVVLAVLDEYTH